MKSGGRILPAVKFYHHTAVFNLLINGPEILKLVEVRAVTGVPGSSRRAVERRPTGTQSGAALFLTAMPGLRAGSPVPTWADQYIFSPRADQS